MSVATKVADTIKGVFTSREAKIQELVVLEERAATQARELKIALDRAQAKVDEIEDRYKELERVKAEVYNFGLRVEREKAERRNWLQDHPTDEVEEFKADLAGLEATIQREGPPDRVERINYLTSVPTLMNGPEIERWNCAVHGPPDPEHFGRNLPSARKRAETAIVTELWRLRDGEQRARIIELRREVKETLKGTRLEHEL